MNVNLLLHTIPVFVVSTIILLGTLISVLPSFTYAFETRDTGAVTIQNSGPGGKVLATAAGHIGGDFHQQITRSGLPFLKPNIVKAINEGHEFADFRVQNQFSSAFHFDGCSFVESTTNINNHYDTVLNLLDATIDPSNPLAPKELEGTRKFGELLHTAQDFYSHSNWVELQNADFISKQKIVDDGLDKWTILSPNTFVKGTQVLVIEGSGPNPTASDPSLTRPSNGHIVFRGETPALISGIAFDDGVCPTNIALGHYDPIFHLLSKKPVDVGKFPIDKLPNALLLISSQLHTKEGITGLNKDNPSRSGPTFGTNSLSGFADARALATTQTTNEWCRLLNLENTINGPNAVSKIFASWVQDKDSAINACQGIPTLRIIVEGQPSICPTGDATTSSLIGAEQQCTTPPTPSQEICGDFIDNDFNGQTDENCLIPPKPTECDPNSEMISRSRGSTGPTVERLQVLLAERGLNPGPIDGIFGRLTDAAVREFQQENNLDVDGIVGPKTWGAICAQGPLVSQAASPIGGSEDTASFSEAIGQRLVCSDGNIPDASSGLCIDGSIPQAINATVDVGTTPTEFLSSSPPPQEQLVCSDGNIPDASSGLCIDGSIPQAINATVDVGTTPTEFP